VAKLPQSRVRVLIVEDEANLAEMLAMGLRYEGFEVTCAADGSQALGTARSFDPQVVVLDVMLPQIDGWSVCQRLRRPGRVILMLTARDDVDDRVRGLDLGADDYLVKPFAFRELLARIRAQLRHLHREQSDRLEFGPVRLDRCTHQVRGAAGPVELTPREYDLLELFLTHPRQVLSKDQILDRVWGQGYFGDHNVVEVYVGYLRQKLGDRDHLLIQTVRGFGYRLGQ
jgi:DNA-binding response OmpR family regulator